MTKKGPQEYFGRSQIVNSTLWDIVGMKIYIFLTLHDGTQFSDHELLNNLITEPEVQLLVDLLSQEATARGTRGGYWEPASHIGAIASKLSQKYPRINHFQGYCPIKGSKDDVFMYI